jgi:hypothetical protein
MTFLGELSAFHIGLVWFAMSAISVGLGGALLRAQGVSNAKVPIDLIKS